MYIEDIQERQRQYRINNKEKLNEKSREWNEENKDRKRQLDFEYREKYKNEISLQRKELMTCECGSELRKSDLSTHRKTRKHNVYEFLKSIEN